MRSGGQIWKYQTAAILNKAPRVTADVVYQYVYGKGLTAIDKKSGKFMWRLKGGLDLLAQSDSRAYCITDKGKLAVMDNKKAKLLYTVNFAGVTRYASNVTGSRIYIANKAGRIVCLMPTEW